MKILAGKRIGLGMIVVISAGLRLINLDTLPFGFHVDEAMNGFVGRYILKNGIDLYGHRWPLFYFDNFGDYPNVLPMYLSGFSTLLMGLNPWAVRLPIALMGVLGVYLIYRLGLLVWGKEQVALLAALLLAIMPWHIVLSRATAEGVTASTVFLVGLLLILRGLTQKKWSLLIWGMGIWSVTYWLYPSYRIVVPLATIPLYWLTQVTSLRRIIVGAGGILLMLTAFIASTAWGTGRFEQTSITSHQSESFVRQTEFIAGDRQGSRWVTRWFHNKAITYGREWLHQWGSYFTLDYLAGNGGEPLRYTVPGVGVMYYAYVILFLLGMASGGLKQQGPIYRYLLYLLGVAAIPAALTRTEVPNIHRSSLMAPLWAMVIAGVGWQVLQYKWRKHYIMSEFLGLLVLLECGYGAHQYWQHSRDSQRQARGEAQWQLAGYIREREGAYRLVHLPNESGLPMIQLFLSDNTDRTLSTQFKPGMKIDRIGTWRWWQHTCPGDESTLPELERNDLIVQSVLCEQKPYLTKIDEVGWSPELRAYNILVPNEKLESYKQKKG